MHIVLCSFRDNNIYQGHKILGPWLKFEREVLLELSNKTRRLKHKVPRAELLDISYKSN